MNNPLPTIGMSATYLTWVLIIGPIYMRDRKPMDIKNIIIIYNAFQVLLSAYMFFEVSIIFIQFGERSPVHVISFFFFFFHLSDLIFAFVWSFTSYSIQRSVFVLLGFFVGGLKTNPFLLFYPADSNSNNKNGIIIH